MALALAFVLVLTRSSLYLIASVPGLVFVCRLALCWYWGVLSLTRCSHWHWRVRCFDVGVGVRVGAFVLSLMALALAQLLAWSLSCSLVACSW